MEESDRELIERLRHRATEHRNFFGSAKDYELMEEAAQALSKPAETQPFISGEPDTVTSRSPSPEHMRMALIMAANTFRDYARQHRAKGTPEGDEKAARNDDMAAMCERSTVSKGNRRPEPAHSLPVGEGWREAVARIIDPLWAELSDEIARVEIGDTSLDGDQPAVLATAKAEADRRHTVALAKADQISALGREGEQGTSVAESGGTASPKSDSPCKSEGDA